MKNIIFVLIVFTISSYITKSKEIINKDVKLNYHSIYFTTSTGELYYSGDFGYTFKKLNTKTALISNNQLKTRILKSTYFDGNFLEYTIDTKVVGPIKLVLSNYIGNTQEVLINANTSREGRIKLKYPNNQLILNVFSDKTIIETLKLIK